MAPNLFVAAQTACQPQKWFRKSSPCQLKQTEERSEPVPGMYRHTVQGWYLVARKDLETGEMKAVDHNDQERVIYWHPSHSMQLLGTVADRSFIGSIEGDDSHKEKWFYCMSTDGATWIQCWDQAGQESIPGPYERYILDAETRKFNRMTKGDQRHIKRLSASSSQSRPQSSSNSPYNHDSPASSLHCSRATTPAGSRRTSLEHERPSFAEGFPQGKRGSLAVPGQRSRDKQRSSSPSPSPLSTPELEKDLKDINAKLEEVNNQ